MNLLVQVNEIIDRPQLFLPQVVGQLLHPRTGWRSLKIWHKLARQNRIVLERILLGVLLQEEIERIRDGKIRHEIDFHGEL